MQLEIKNSKANISKQEGIIKRAKFDVSTFENYIKVARNNINRITQEKRNEDDDKSWGIVETIEDKQKREEIFLKKTALIKKIIEKEKRRIRDKKRKILIAERSIKEENKKIEEVKTIVKEAGLLKDQLGKEHMIFSERIEMARKQKLKRELSLNIHKRLSPPFSCLTFILIGVPLGIMTRSSSMLVSLGISFILMLFFYYPLVATGLILAESMSFPIIPSLWGANVFNLIVGLVLFRSIFNK